MRISSDVPHQIGNLGVFVGFGVRCTLSVREGLASASQAATLFGQIDFEEPGPLVAVVLANGQDFGDRLLQHYPEGEARKCG